jgi:hypothetical protein
MNRLLVPLISALAIASIPGAAPGQADPPGPTVIALHPAGEPTPALKYTLLPEPRELVPGNAAIFYHRGIQLLLESQMVQERQARSEGRDRPAQTEDDISDWINGPLDQIPIDQARAQLDRFDRVLREVELGALREDCDWEFDSRPESIDLLLPEIQSTRSLARLVSLKVRVAILDGDTDLAVHWLRTGYALARHVSDGPTVIQSLVGLAIANVMNGDLIQLIQAGSTPCLYWAIARLPDPIVDMSAGLVGERSLLERMLPDLEELDGPPWSVERGRLFLDALASQLKGLTDSAPSDAGSMKLLLAGIVARVYPDAKRSLVASGMGEAEVEAMPAIQAVGLVALRDYRALSDDLYKWTSLPYQEVYRDLERVNAANAEADRLSRPGLALFLIIYPSLSAVQLAEVRVDRQLEAIRCVEAIRLHASSNGGQFPPSLDEIDEVPVPIDPATGAPFSFEVDGETATLTAPLIPGGPDHPAYRIDFELRLAD